MFSKKSLAQVNNVISQLYLSRLIHVNFILFQKVEEMDGNDLMYVKLGE